MATPIPVSPILYERLRLAPWHGTTHVQPHSYIVQREDPELYGEMLHLITEHGYTAEFRGALYRYLNLDGFKYWSLAPVLNREPLPATGDGGSPGDSR